MGIPVTASSTPLVFETLPAIKVTNYSFAKILTNLYTYARFYVHNGSLVVGVYGFKESPDEQDRISLVVGQKNRYLLLSISPRQASLVLADDAATLQTQTGVQLPAPSLSPFAGTDEQGWFWGAEAILSADVLQQAGLVLTPGAQFGAAVFYHRSNQEEFGTSFAYNPLLPLIHQPYPAFTVVSY
ncbi:MAG: hypothetical protein ACK5JF_14380 [Oscillospiraceae bacterium]